MVARSLLRKRKRANKRQRMMQSEDYMLLSVMQCAKCVTENWFVLRVYRKRCWLAWLLAVG